MLKASHSASSIIGHWGYVYFPLITKGTKENPYCKPKLNTTSVIILHWDCQCVQIFRTNFIHSLINASRYKCPWLEAKRMAVQKAQMFPRKTRLCPLYRSAALNEYIDHFKNGSSTDGSVDANVLYDCMLIGNEKCAKYIAVGTWSILTSETLPCSKKNFFAPFPASFRGARETLTGR